MPWNPFDKIGQEVDETITKLSIKDEAYDNLSRSYQMGMDALFEASDRMTIEYLQDLGIGSYDSMLKLSKFQESTVGRYGGSTGAAIAKGVNGIASVVDTVTDVADRLNNIFNTSDIYKRNLGTVPPSALDKSIGTEDPISRKVDIRERVFNIAERCGYSQDKVLSIGYSRNYTFTSRPTLASDAAGQYKSYVFFTRPNCNLIQKTDEGMYRLAPELLNYDSMFTLMSTDPKLYSELCRNNCQESNYFRFLSNYVKEVPPMRLAETERAGIENMYGYSTPVAGAPEYHNVEATVTFMDNYRGDIAKLLYAMSRYRHIVSKRGYAMRPEYTKNRGDDTLMTMYIVTCTANMEIVGFGVALNGVIVDTPSHFTQHRLGGFNKEELLDNFTVTIRFSTYYPNCPKYFDHFNNIFNFNPMDCVDLKGQTYNMVAPGRAHDMQTSGHSTRAYLFGENFGVELGKFKKNVNGIVDTTQKVVDVVGKGYDTARAVMNHADSFNTVKGMLSKSELLHNNEYVESVEYKYKGMFEFLAKNPGVYAATSKNPLEKGRIIYKLGFSY